MQSAEAVQSVKRRSLIAFRERRIVKHRVHEICDFAFQKEHGLPDVQKLRRILAENMHAEELQRLAMKKQLQPAVSVTRDLSPGNLAIVSNANFVGHIGIGKLLFGLPDE